MLAQLPLSPNLAWSSQTVITRAFCHACKTANRRRRRRHRLKGIHSRSDTNRTGAEGLCFYYPRLLHSLNQMLAVVLLSQYRVSSSKTVRPRAPCGARCIGHAVSIWFAVCSKAPHSQFVKERDPICAWTNGIAQHQSAGG